MSEKYDGFECYKLDDNHRFHVGRLPGERVLNADEFESLWHLHPEEYHKITIHGREVATPRWQQAYGSDYHYTGRVNKALPVPPLLSSLLEWCQTTIDIRLNGILVNWYNGQLKHYIGAHRDSTKNMAKGSPIVTISFGEQRIFRLRPWKGRKFTDFKTADGCVFVMPYETNLAWTHEVPHFGKCQGRRISVTARAFSPN